MHRIHIERGRNAEHSRVKEGYPDRYISLTVYKIDSNTGIGLAGAVFQLTECSGHEAYGETNDEGEAVFSLAACSEYQLVEVIPPVGYTQEGHIYDICVDQYGCVFVDGWRTDRITAGNIAVTGRFTAIKIDGENNVPLSGAVYTLLQNNSAVATSVSTETGAVTFTGLSPGAYELAETTAPDGFQMNDERMAVIVSPDGSVTIEGEPADGFLLIDVPLQSLVFRKQNTLTGAPLDGAVFELSQNGTEIATATSGPNGVVDFGVLPEGSYFLTETEVPAGFQLSSTVYEVIVGSDGSVTVGGTSLESFIAENAPIDSFTAIKVNVEDGNPLAGAAYTLFQDSVEVDSTVSTATGAVSFSSLVPGTYELVETSPPSGFQANAGRIPVAVSTDGVVTIMDEPADGFLLTDEPVSASFTATKVNIEDESPLAGATYTLFRNSVEVNSAVSSATGAVSFSSLVPGTYELVETSPPSGFQTNPESLPVVVAQDGTVTIDDQPADGFALNDVPLGEFVFEKLDASSGASLSGATFRLSQSGEEFDTVVSGAGGLVNFGILLPGVYELEEIAAPSGYEPDTAVYEVVVNADGTITVGGTPLEEFNIENSTSPILEQSAPPVINDISQGAIIVTGTGIAGSTVEVRFPSGATVTTTVSPEDTWVVNVPAGENLVGGNQVYAAQAEIGKSTSEEVFVFVLAPVLEATSETV